MIDYAISLSLSRGPEFLCFDAEPMGRGDEDAKDGETASQKTNTTLEAAESVQTETNRRAGCLLASEI